MSGMIGLKKVSLHAGHLHPGRTAHAIVDAQGRREFPPFTRLVISQFPGHAGYYLMHLCANGECADTWHESIDDAIYQAEWEFGVRPEEWTDTNEPF